MGSVKSDELIRMWKESNVLRRNHENCNDSRFEPKKQQTTPLTATNNKNAAQ
jgi:hypothetical protein